MSKYEKQLLQGQFIISNENRFSPTATPMLTVTVIAGLPNFTRVRWIAFHWKLVPLIHHRREEHLSSSTTRHAISTTTRWKRQCSIRNSGFSKTRLKNVIGSTSSRYKRKQATLFESLVYRLSSRSRSRCCFTLFTKHKGKQRIEAEPLFLNPQRVHFIIVQRCHSERVLLVF